MANEYRETSDEAALHHALRTALERDIVACDQLLALLIKNHPEQERPVKRATWK